MMIFRLLLFSAAVGGYTYLRVVAPLAWGARRKAAAAVALGVVALRLPVLELLRGDSVYSAALPPWLNILYSWLFIALLMWFCGVFALTIAGRSVLRAVGAWRRLSDAAQQSCCTRLHGLMLAGALCLSAWGTWSGVQPPVLRELSLHGGLPQPLRVALLTDLHVSTLQEPDTLRRLVERTNALGADVVCITGDFVDGSVEECAERMAVLRELRAPLGIYGVAGNHDYYSGYDAWRTFLTEHGVRMLDNEHVLLPNGVVMAGVTEETALKLPGMQPPDLPKALRGVPSGARVILLSHRPNVVQEAAQHGVAVQLSGHTHGGIVWGVGQIVALMNSGYLVGHYTVGNTQLYISGGTGTGSRTPLRIATPAELTLITID